MNRALKAPTAFALAAEALRREGAAGAALKLLNEGMRSYPYATATTVSLLLTLTGGEQTVPLRQLLPGFPVPRYLIDQLLQAGEISGEEAQLLKSVNLKHDRLAGEPDRKPAAASGKSDTAASAESDVEGTGEPDAQTISRTFQRELEQVLHRGGRRPPPELIEALKPESSRGKSRPVASRRLAELLEQQGHLAEALAMYRILPDRDGRLQNHIRLLEQKLLG